MAESIIGFQILFPSPMLILLTPLVTHNVSGKLSPVHCILLPMDSGAVSGLVDPFLQLSHKHLGSIILLSFSK